MQNKFSLLIVDRNPRIRNFLKREFQSEGYKVQLAKNGKELMDLIYSSVSIDLVVIDPDIPDVNPPNLFKCLENRIPELPVVIHGYSSDDIESSWRLRTAMFIPKRGSSSEALKGVIRELIMKSYPKRFNTVIHP